MKLSQIAWMPVTKSVVKEYGRADVPGLAAEMAYWIIFSIIPFFSFLAMLAGITGQSIGRDDVLDSVTKNLYSVLDPSTADTLRGLLAQVLAPESGVLSIGVVVSALLALNSASTAVLTMMKAFNRAYGVAETRNFVVLRLTGVGLTVLLVVLLIGGSILLIVGGKLIGLLTLGPLGGFALHAARIIVALAIINLGLEILYWRGVDLKQRFVWPTPGSLLATIVLSAFSGLFSLYVQFFASASFNKTYGSIAGVFLFLLFLRITSTIILIGAEFNAEVCKRYEPEVLRDRIIDPSQLLSVDELASNRRSADETLRRWPALDERLAALRARPFNSAVAGVQDAIAQRTSAERAERATTAIVAAGFAALTAVGATLAGILRRRA